MKFFIKNKGKARAHLWTGTDTVCRMYSTGGLGRKADKRYSVQESTRGRYICTMCFIVSKKLHESAQLLGTGGGGQEVP